MAIASIAVFCGSKKGNSPCYSDHAEEIGQLLAQRKIKMIYGGGSVGLMGVIADAVMNNGGWVIGIIPKLLLAWEVEHRSISELIICDDMHERKLKIYSKADAALVLPGGVGTLDELFEVLTWNQLTIHDKEIFLLNINQFYDPLLQQLQMMRTEGFLTPTSLEKLHVLQKPEELAYFL
ncbi:MAG: TIGR00730 family Rossman fold protein [Bacteroidetes bacterium]|nr:TIGR00730 family Rossman fold protein [Bacteroidota bacterium]